MKKTYQFLLIIASFCFQLSYSASISGKITETNNNVVTFATVACYSSFDSTMVSSCTSDSIGNFTLQNISPGKYYIKCALIGYTSSTLQDVKVENNDSKITLNPIIINESSQELKEFMVVAESNTDGGIDKSSYRISEKLISLAPTGADVLKYVPSVQVDLMNNISVEGSSNIQYLIDGRKVSAEDVKQIDSRKIAKVEVVHNPSSKYDADITAVINVILKINVIMGFSGRISTETHYFEKKYSNNDISLEYGYKNLRLFCDGHYNILNTGIEETSSNIDSNLKGYTKNGKGNFNNYNTTINAGIDWKINKSNSFLYLFQYKPKYGAEITGDYTIDYLNNLVSMAYATSNITNTENSRNTKNYLYYKHLFKQADHELTITAEHSKRTNNISNNITETYFAPDRTTVLSPTSTRNYHTLNTRNNAIGSLDYSLPFSKIASLKAGYILNMQLFRNTFNQTEATFNYDEYRHAFYATLHANFKKFNFQAGLRYEQSDILLNDSTNINYYKYLPQASVQYKIDKKQKIKLSYRRSISRPSIQLMNPFVVEIDSLNISRGNPDLNPAYEDRFELSYNWLFRASLYYKGYSDMFQEITMQRPDGRFENYNANVSNGREYGANLSGAIPISKKWMFNISGSVYNREYFDVTAYEILGRNKVGCRASVSSMLQLPKDLSISSILYYTSPYINAQSTIKQEVFYGLGVDKKFKSNLSMGLFWINPLSSMYYFNEKTTYGKGFTNYNKMGGDVTYLICLKISYIFSSGKKLDKPSNNDADDGVKNIF